MRRSTAACYLPAQKVLMITACCILAERGYISKRSRQYKDRKTTAKPRLIPNVMYVSAFILNANTPAPFFCPFLDETTRQVSISGALQLWIDVGQQRHHVVIMVILWRKSCPGVRGTSSTFQSLVTDLQIEYSRNACYLKRLYLILAALRIVTDTTWQRSLCATCVITVQLHRETYHCLILIYKIKN